MRGIICLALVLSHWGQISSAIVPSKSLRAPTSNDCGEELRVGERCNWKIKKLHPTQGSVGFAEIEKKRKELLGMSKREREDYRQKKRVPVVVGPNRVLYMIDHHHSAIALSKVGFDDIPVEVKADLSKLKLSEFWAEMIRRKWAYPFDKDGRPIAAESISDRLSKLEDNPYRSLAGFVRDAGGFEKTGQPFEEFQWAERLRALDLYDSSLEKGYEQAVHQAMALIQWKFWENPRECEEKLRDLIQKLPNSN